uniref:Innexin n=1 Tax=Macrostomum lignano TaxID=282301 RepID=A0A1I8HWB3_9PLAT
VETRQTIGYCAERWPDKSLRLVYSIGAFCLQFCTPLIVTGALYFCIYRRLMISFAFFWSPWSVFNVVSEVEQYKKLNPQKVAAFIDCINVTKSWDVINANMRLLMEPDNSSIVHDSWNILELFVRLFALGSACVNPYLYGWLNEEIRASLKACLPRRCRSLLNSGGGRTDPDEERLKTLGEQSTSKCQQIPMTEEAVVAQQIDGEDPDDADQSRNGGSSTTAALIVHSQPGVTEST